MLYRSDKKFINFLFNIREHLDKDWDFFLVISGVTGAGKSIFMLHIIELWYRVIIGRKISVKDVDKITGDIITWVKNLQDLDDYDMNIYDEGLLTMDSKDSLTKTQKEVKKIFNTVRSSKKILNVIIVQDWFSLTKYFREQRANSLVYIYKRGEYKLFSKEGIKYLNGFNERKSVKNMGVAYPIHLKGFPDYKGILRKPYYDYINKLKVKEMNNSINIINQSKNYNTVDVIIDDVRDMLNKGLTYKDMRKELGVGSSTISRAIMQIKNE